MAKRICFHGTNITAALRIEEEGFRPDTWFARHLEDALAYGGNHVSLVAFDDPPDDWQFHVLEAVPRERIVKRWRIEYEEFEPLHRGSK